MREYEKCGELIFSKIEMIQKELKVEKVNSKMTILT
jgi:hypothetical protein